MMYEQYNAFTIPHLIKQVQTEYLILTDPAQKKKIPTARIMSRLATLRELQYHLTDRLKTLDRNKCTFFPVGCYVEYNDFKYMKTIQERAIVEAHDEVNNNVLVKFDKKPDEIVQVSPLKLKLLYIKKYYI